MSSRGPLPNRWLHCPRKSEEIIAERFIAFKTPLSSHAFKSQLPIECLFPPEMLFGYMNTIKKKLGLWIDLTNTNRFYDREAIEACGAKYFKLQCRGHGETPSIEQTHAFIEIVEEFITERPFDIVGVHCTHGFNRTGFLIVSFLVERLDCSVEAALAVFARARPPGIYKQDYINELFHRYENGEAVLQAPELPAWYLEYDDSTEHDSRKRDYNGLIVGHENDIDEVNSDNEGGNDHGNDNPNSQQLNNSENNEKPAKKRRREIFIKDATFMPGVPGVSLVTDQPRLGQLQLKVQEMCGWNKSGFPGSQPVSMDRKNLTKLHEQPYRVSWKADGVRYMMLINNRNDIYFFDRNHTCFQVDSLSFPKTVNLNEHLTDTLLDGEMVLDKYQGSTTPRYLIYDIIKICTHENIGMKPFYPDRIRCIKEEVIKPRSNAIMKGLINRQAEPFGVRHKDFWEIKQSASLLGEKFAKSLSHTPDGLIFQPSTSPYVPGVCSDVLKWKPIYMNSVDFRLKISMESGVGILSKKIGLLYVGGQDVPFANIKYTSAIRELDNRIIECTLENGQWKFMRERTDKTMPNSYNTAKSVLESIKYPVTEEVLLDYIRHCGYSDKPPHVFNKPLPPRQQIQQPQQQQQQQHQQQQEQQQQNHHL